MTYMHVNWARRQPCLFLNGREKAQALGFWTMGTPQTLPIWFLVSLGIVGFSRVTYSPAWNHPGRESAHVCAFGGEEK
jgi:hypothetical protein